jgi:hypothetical protein
VHSISAVLQNAKLGATSSNIEKEKPRDEYKHAINLTFDIEEQPALLRLPAQPRSPIYRLGDEYR